MDAMTNNEITSDNIQMHVRDIAKAEEEEVLCGHVQRIIDDNDAYYVQCSDGKGDVCEGCVENTASDVLIYLPDADGDSVKGLKYKADGEAIHPYWNKEEHEWKDYVEWVFLGTVAELKALLASNDEEDEEEDEDNWECTECNNTVEELHDWAGRNVCRDCHDALEDEKAKLEEIN